MTTATIDVAPTRVRSVSVSGDALVVELNDGRTITVPLAWYPRLLAGTEAERTHWRLIGDGQGVHWADLDEDISVLNILASRPSNESSRSLEAWLSARTSNRS